MGRDRSLRPVRTTDRWHEEPIAGDDSGDASTASASASPPDSAEADATAPADESASDPDDGVGRPRVVVTRQTEPRNRLDALLFRLFGTPRERDLRLDPVGSEVWRRCDGDHTVAEIEAALAARFSEERISPVEETLSYFLAQLSELDLVRFER